MDMLEGKWNMGYLPDNLGIPVIARDGESFRVLKTYTDVIKNWLYSLRQLYFYRKKQSIINEIETYIDRADSLFTTLVYGKQKELPIYESYLKVRELFDEVFAKWKLDISPSPKEEETTSSSEQQQPSSQEVEQEQTPSS